MTISDAKVNEILDILRNLYPDWNNFSDPQFERDEVTYKQETIAKARDLLSEGEFQRLLQASQVDELISRFETVGRDNNLLWNNVPKSGDLGILYQPTLDKAGFCRAVFDLLHGPGPSYERLDRYVDHVTSQGLPNKWTFPTYFLFVVHPDTEIFIKPTPIVHFLHFVGSGINYHATTNGETYRAILELVGETRAAFGQFGPRDNVDIQGLIWSCYYYSKIVGPLVEPSVQKFGLAEPFASIFLNREEAEWAFDFLRDSLQLLGVTNAESPMVSITFPVRHGGKLWRINYGQWVVIDFRGPTSYTGQGVNLALLESRMEQLRLDENLVHWDSFSPTTGYESISVYELPWLLVHDMDERFQAVYRESFETIRGIFGRWKSSNLQKYHQKEVLEAVFDDRKRDRLLSKGTTTVMDTTFSVDSFELLAKMHENPTRDYYVSNKSQFVTLVEEPFQQLLHRVIGHLPAAITGMMETEKRLFSRFLKNDWGQGGAWDFYWGALYPKGGKRTDDPQLALWMTYNRLEFGFYIGDYGAAPRARFATNCRRHANLQRILEESLSGDKRFVFGASNNFDAAEDGSLIVKKPATWAAFLADPAAYDFDVSVVLTRQQVLTLSSDELAEEIAQVYSKLFPLVLLACEEDPLPAIARYLGPGSGPDEEREIHPEYLLSEIADETGFEEADLRSWVRAIERKGQAIFYGPPGTGKTFIAEQMAKHLVGGGDGVIELVQFHPAYAYEDFIQGIRPESDGKRLTYPTKPGRFLDFIARARQRTGMSVLIIDEINRANLARVFGELMFLLEYRDREIPLAGGGKLRIPKDVRVIGTMNTADRSIALVDHALRRRFAFIALHPDYEVLRHYHRRYATGFALERLISVLESLNKDIGDRHYEVGITYFLDTNLKEKIEDIWRMEIAPYLEEYFFDQPEKVASYRWEQVEAKILES